MIEFCVVYHTMVLDFVIVYVVITGKHELIMNCGNVLPVSVKACLGPFKRFQHLHQHAFNTVIEPNVEAGRLNRWFNIV